MEIDKIFAVSVSAIALVFSLINYNRARSAVMYQDLDRLYLELLKIGIANPSFVNPAMTSDYKTKFTGDTKFQYELYAFMAWNICETIHDRQDSKSFFKTWKCIIKVENDLHRNWFDSKENHCRFKEDFQNYITNDPTYSQKK